MSKPKRIVLSLVFGVLITAVLTIIAFAGETRQWGCTFAWQACLTQQVIHTPDNPLHEGSPIDLFGFAFGVLLGVPIYGGLTYAALSLAAKSRK
ncbi:MAG TPA: hypothetical protein VJ715_00485 [Pyrinomonadaceae bacterium]|nr:hypothetical protein [Pyrinomonadaceae bacterium]